MNKFKAFANQIVVEPFKAEALFDDEKLQEVGKVIAIGSKVTFAKVGDTLFFNKEGIRQTQKLSDTDTSYYVILEEPEFILGKIPKKNETKEKPTMVK